jgi:hypothetical protein
MEILYNVILNNKKRRDKDNKNDEEKFHRNSNKTVLNGKPRYRLRFNFENIY